MSDQPDPWATVGRFHVRPLQDEPTPPQEPPADTIQAVRELYRDDRDAMAQAIFSLRADLAEAATVQAAHAEAHGVDRPNGIRLDDVA